MAQVSVSASNGEMTIRVAGRFDFNVHKEFRAAYEQTLGGGSVPAKYIIDFGATEYIDSSALGMLLMLRERAGKGAHIVIVHCNQEIKDILGISNFNKLFNIE
ncbi:MAG: STAS domain-containing protein [Gammaproteobacteria bacterium]|nr:STAS domain-containing protein [Gammaproteobacteria bacterium]